MKRQGRSSRLRPIGAASVRCARSGFTLIELLVVMAIIGMVVATVSVSMEAILPGERLNTNIRELAADLMKARSESIGRNMQFTIEYDLTNERYRMATPFRVGGGRILTVDDPTDEQQRFYTSWTNMKAGVEIKSVVIGGEEYLEGVVGVAFDPLGSASDHSIILTQPAYENAFTIEVLALTGLIRMHDGEYFRQEPDDGDFD